MTLAHVGLFVLGVFVGATIGALTMGLLNASGPNVDEAIHLLRGMYALAVTRTPVSYRQLETVSRFLMKYGGDV